MSNDFTDSNENTKNPEDLFEKAGLELSSGQVEVGKTYPIYGMITNFLEEGPGRILVEINYNIQAEMTIPDAKKINVLKERAFEPGIFVSTVTAKDDSGIKVRSTTVVFGKKQAYAA